MDNIILTILVVIIIGIVGVLVWLYFQHNKLRKDLVIVRDSVERNKRDIAGLCSAAVSVDGKLSDNNEQLNDIVEKVADFEQHEQQDSQPYHSAIQRVKNGSTAAELIEQCGLSREEAMLLIRLHGNR